MHSWQKGAVFGVAVALVKIIAEYTYKKFAILNFVLHIVLLAVFYGLIFRVAKRLLEFRKTRAKTWQRETLLGLIVIPLVMYTFFNTLQFIGNAPMGIHPFQPYFMKNVVFSMFLGILLTPLLLMSGSIKSRGLKTIFMAALVLIILIVGGGGFLTWFILMLADLSGGGAVWGVGSGTLYVAEGETKTYSITDTSYPYAVQAEFKINYISSSPKHFLEISLNGDKEIIEIERDFNKSVFLCYRNNTYYERYYVNENRTWWRPAARECELRWNKTYVDPIQVDWISITVSPAYQDKDGDGKICEDPIEIKGEPTCNKYYLPSPFPDANQVDNDGDGLVNEDFKEWYNGKGDWETNTLYFDFQSRHLCSKCGID